MRSQEEWRHPGAGRWPTTPALHHQLYERPVDEVTIDEVERGGFECFLQ
jgi:hypothetical protein